jgi:hypothetical protein
MISTPAMMPTTGKLVPTRPLANRYVAYSVTPQSTTSLPIVNPIGRRVAPIFTRRRRARMSVTMSTATTTSPRMTVERLSGTPQAGSGRKPLPIQL